MKVIHGSLNGLIQEVKEKKVTAVRVADPRTLLSAEKATNRHRVRIPGDTPGGQAPAGTQPRPFPGTSPPEKN